MSGKKQLLALASMACAFSGCGAFERRATTLDQREGVTTVRASEDATAEGDPTDKTPPTPPPGLSAKALGAFQAALTWAAAKDDRPAGIKTYQILRDQKLAGEIDGTLTAYTDAGLKAQTLYTYTVIAIDYAGNASEPSAAASATTTAPTGADLYASNCSQCHGDLATSTKRGRTQAQIAGAIASTTPMAFLKSLDSATVAAIADALSSGPRSTIAPAPLAGLTATALGPTALALVWQAGSEAAGGSGVTGYEIYRDGALLISVGADVLSYQDTNLSAATAYSYTGFVVDQAGNRSAAIQAVTGTTNAAASGVDTTPPSVPTNLVTAVQSASHVKLTWSASTDNTGGVGMKAYRLYRNGLTVADIDAAALSYTDQNLLGGQTYTYAVAALDLANNLSAASPTAAATTTTADGTALYGTGCALCHNALATSSVTGQTAAAIRSAIQGQAAMQARSDLAAFGDEEILAVARVLATTADTTAPSVPAGLAATAKTASQIDLAWSASTDAGSGVRGYLVYRDGAFVTFTATPSLTDGNLAAQSTHAYTVRALDNAGNLSAAGSAASATTSATPDNTPPTVPGGLTAVATASDRVTLTWTAATDTGGSELKAYRILREGVALPDVAAPALTLVDNGLTASTTYHYQIQAIDGAANASDLSAVVVVTTPVAATPTPVPTLTGAQLYANDCAGCHGALASSTELTRTAAQIATAIASIEAMSTNPVLTALTSAQVALIAGALADTTAPSLPTSLSATAASATAINLSWGASVDTGGSGLKAYKVYRAGVLLKTVAAPSTGASDTGLTASTTYSYQVSAVDNANNESAKTAAVSATTQAPPTVPDTTPPSVPTGVQAVASAYNTISLSWTASVDNVGGSGVASYKIFRGGTYLRSVSAPLTNLADATLTAQTAYTYAISAVDAKGNESAKSASVSATTPAIDGKALYAADCAACHGPLASSAKLGAAAADITFALSHITAMSQIVLDPQQVAAVAAALVPTEPPIDQRTDLFSYTPPVGTRWYVAGKLSAVFLPTTAYTSNDTAINNVLTNDLLHQVSGLGGPCNREDAYCQGEGALTITLAAPMAPLPNAVRSGYITRACEESLSNNNAVTNALTRAGLTVASTPGQTQLQQVYQLFFLGQTPAASVTTSLAAIHHAALSANLSTTEAWRFVLLGMCESIALDAF